mmetsp:Transcript_19761/g.75767  ORF Transcript_19761/g.75767 Transcript_19761/m.75767 type:complete len:263 (-) Transcript_19761:222-1010(-)
MLCLTPPPSLPSTSTVGVASRSVSNISTFLDVSDAPPSLSSASLHTVAIVCQPFSPHACRNCTMDPALQTLRCSAAPALMCDTTGVNLQLSFLLITTPSTPKKSAERSTAPRLWGSWILSSTTQRGAPVPFSFSHCGWPGGGPPSCLPTPRSGSFRRSSREEQQSTMPWWRCLSMPSFDLVSWSSSSLVHRTTGMPSLLFPSSSRYRQFLCTLSSTNRAYMSRFLLSSAASTEWLPKMNSGSTLILCSRSHFLAATIFMRSL